MKTLTIDHKNGHSTTYQLIEDGSSLPIAYHLETPKEVINVLENCRKNRIRVKVYLGDIKTGRDWNEENDVTGYIGLSKGSEARFPILVHNERSMGGGSLMDDCILKIKESKGKRVLYCNPIYKAPVIEIHEGSTIDGYTHVTLVNGETFGHHKSLASAKRLQTKLS